MGKNKLQNPPGTQRETSFNWLVDQPEMAFPVKDQGATDNCAVAATIHYLELYVWNQQLMDCTVWKPKIGARPQEILDYVHFKGVYPADIYPYQFKQSNLKKKCRISEIAKDDKHKFQRFGEPKVLYGKSVQEVERLLMEKGPLITSIHTSSEFKWAHKRLTNREQMFDPKDETELLDFLTDTEKENFIINPRDCAKIPATASPEARHLIEKLNHQLILIGFGENNRGEQYWLLKNSWGPNSGDNGYLKVYKNDSDNVCGITRELIFVVDM